MMRDRLGRYLRIVAPAASDQRVRVTFTDATLPERKVRVEVDRPKVAESSILRSE